jgi:hypothetical protein
MQTQAPKVVGTKSRNFCSPHWMLLSFVTTLHDDYKSSKQDVMVFWDATQTRNPRFKDAHTGTKRRLDVKTSNRD